MLATDTDAACASGLHAPALAPTAAATATATELFGRTIDAEHKTLAKLLGCRAESFRANTFDAASAYVAISRARKGAAVYTDSRASLEYPL